MTTVAYIKQAGRLQKLTKACYRSSEQTINAQFSGQLWAFA